MGEIDLYFNGMYGTRLSESGIFKHDVIHPCFCVLFSFCPSEAAERPSVGVGGKPPAPRKGSAVYEGIQIVNNDGH